jgi:hypothetical protein
LPYGFKKIRHYGLYASGSKQRALALTALPPKAEPSASNAEPTEPTPDVELLPVWRERCCPHCDVTLFVLAQIPRPARSPWRPP